MTVTKLAAFLITFLSLYESLTLAVPLEVSKTPYKNEVTGRALLQKDIDDEAPHRGGLGKYFLYIKCTTCKIDSELMVKDNGFAKSVVPPGEESTEEESDCEGTEDVEEGGSDVSEDYYEEDGEEDYYEEDGEEDYYEEDGEEDYYFEETPSKKKIILPEEVYAVIPRNVDTDEGKDSEERDREESGRSEYGDTEEKGPPLHKETKGDFGEEEGTSGREGFPIEKSKSKNDKDGADGKEDDYYEEVEKEGDYYDKIEEDDHQEETPSEKKPQPSKELEKPKNETRKTLVACEGSVCMEQEVKPE